MLFPTLENSENIALINLIVTLVFDIDLALFYLDFVRITLHTT